MSEPLVLAPLHAGATTPQQTGLVVFFAVGLLGGVHCIGMCGPLVALYADRMNTGDRITWQDTRQHLLFNLGRTAGYAVAGALLGALGALVVDAAALVSLANGVRAGLGLLVGAAVVATGVGYLVRGRVGGHDLPLVGDLFQRVSGVLAGRVDRWVDGPTIALLGVVHAALPCPILYPAYLYAFARGSPVVGALSLAALGFGTIPSLFVSGTIVQSLDARARGNLHRVLGVLFVVMGYFLLAHGLMAVGVEVPHPSLPMPQSPQ